MISDLTTIKNPFNTAAFASKVPDGKCGYSIGVKRQVSKQIVSSKGAKIFVLTPTFNCSGFNCDVVGNVIDGIEYHTFSDSDITVRAPSATALAGTAAATVETNLTLGNNSPEKWRMVSAGMKITLTNNSEKNDGWFEAIRVNASPSSKDYVFLKNVGQDEGILGVHPFFEDSIIGKSESWVNHPSYVTGKLRDLHKHMFILQQVNGSRDFCTIRQNNTSSGFKDPQIPIGAFKSGPSEAFTFKNADEIEHWADDSCFDVVLVKCYSATDTVGSSTTNLHLHMVHNHEYIYDSLSTYSKFQTPTSNMASSVLRATALINSDSKPSIPFDSAPGQLSTCIQACKKTSNKSGRSKTTRSRKKSKICTTKRRSYKRTGCGCKSPTRPPSKRIRKVSA